MTEPKNKGGRPLGSKNRLPTVQAERTREVLQKRTVESLSRLVDDETLKQVIQHMIKVATGKVRDQKSADAVNAAKLLLTYTAGTPTEVREPANQQTLVIVRAGAEDKVERNGHVVDV